MEVFIFWFLFSIICGVAASNRGRSGFGYFLLAMLISPLLGILLVYVMPDRSGPGETAEERVKCPDCRELILKDARVCKHCGCKLIPQ